MNKLIIFPFLILLLFIISCGGEERKSEVASEEVRISGKWDIIMVAPLHLDTLEQGLQEIYKEEMAPLLEGSYLMFNEDHRFSGDISGDVRKGEWKLETSQIIIHTGSEQQEKWAYEWNDQQLLITTGVENDPYVITLVKTKL